MACRNSSALDKLALCFARKTLGLDSSDELTVTSIQPGVSSNLWLCRAGSKVAVLKQPLATLRATSVWTAPLSRSRFEALWLRFAAGCIPEQVPSLLGYDESIGMLAMEYLPESNHVVWKRQLLAGEAQPQVASQVGRALATTHSVSASDANIRRQFHARPELAATRLYPYFDFVAGVHADLVHIIRSLKHGVSSASTVVVHGDVTPKNILIGPNGPVLLDAECACIGDPAFDIAFFLALLCVKGIHQPSFSADYVRCADAFLDAYGSGVDWEDADDIFARAVPLLGLFLLGRVDGLARVDYVTSEPTIEEIRTFGRSILLSDWSKPLGLVLEGMVRC